MTRPNSYEPGFTYLVTQRCLERRFFLKPTPEVNEAILYCLLYAVMVYGLELHGFAFLSNHYHLVLTDPGARLPCFASWFNGILARCLNCKYGRSDKFWTARSYGRQILGDRGAVVEELVYTMANPVSSGLVARPESWPGLVSRPADLETRVYRARRPDWFFGKNSGLPEVVEGRCTVPSRHRSPGVKRFVESVGRRLEGRLEELHRERIARGGKLVGVKRIRAQRITDRPRTPGGEGTPNPLLVCKDRVLREALEARLRNFREAYGPALEAFRQGDREVLFPHGTFKMRVVCGAKCREPPPW